MSFFFVFFSTKRIPLVSPNNIVTHVCNYYQVTKLGVGLEKCVAYVGNETDMRIEYEWRNQACRQETQRGQLYTMKGNLLVPA